MARIPDVDVKVRMHGAWKLALAAFLGKLAARRGVKVEIEIKT